ncbi:MAG: hypothetical protein QXP99_04400 [Thermoproteota archaeon]
MCGEGSADSIGLDYLKVHAVGRFLYENVAQEPFPKVKKALEDCRRLVTEFFG